jgi:hypothetical protein
MGVGHSADLDGHRAGADATAAALVGRQAKLLVVFASVALDLVAVLAGVNQAGGGAPVIGCSSGGEIAHGGPYDGSVVVTAIGGAGFSVATAAEANVSGRQRQAGEQLAARATEGADDPARPYRVLIILSDGLLRQQELVLRGAYSVVGAEVPLFGGAAGDGGRMLRTFELYGDAVMTDGVVAAYLCSEAPLTVTIGHGWSRVGEAMIVTAAAGGRVTELDHEPALDAYLHRLEAPAEAYADAGAFTVFALGRPVGVQRRSGEAVVNFSTEVGLEDRSLGGGIDVPQGSLVWPMTSTTGSVLAAVEKTCAEAEASLGGRAPVGYFTFSCAALRALIGEEGIAQEGERLAAHAKGTAYAGFYTYGEIARTRGIDGFHNQTLVVLALS